MTDHTNDLIDTQAALIASLQHTVATQGRALEVMRASLVRLTRDNEQLRKERDDAQKRLGMTRPMEVQA